VVVYGEGEPGAKEANEAEWIKTLEVKDRLAVSLTFTFHVLRRQPVPAAHQVQ